MAKGKYNARKRKVKKNVPNGVAHIRSTFNNTIVTITDEEGNVIYEYALANPKIVSNSIEKAYLKNGEGCLSVDNEHQGYIHRSARIKVKAYDLLQDKQIEIKAEGYLAIVLQHELDHFKGVLFYDYINNNDPFKIEENAIEID